MNSRNVWENSLFEAAEILNRVRQDSGFVEKCVEFTNILTSAIRSGANIFSCGNGGSHCDAMHFAEELTGKYRKERPPIGALALGDPSHVTCTGNDYGFDHIFERQLRGLGRRGDVLIGLSTSGNSKNVLLAFEAAKGLGMRTIALLGRDGGKLNGVADLAIVVPAETSDRIQEVHIKLLHTVIEAVEREIFPANYAP